MHGVFLLSNLHIHEICLCMIYFFSFGHLIIANKCQVFIVEYLIFNFKKIINWNPIQCGNGFSLFIQGVYPHGVDLKFHIYFYVLNFKPTWET
jgi:hypothetical protein